MDFSDFPDAPSPAPAPAPRLAPQPTQVDRSGPVDTAKLPPVPEPDALPSLPPLPKPPAMNDAQSAPTREQPRRMPPAPVAQPSPAPQADPQLPALNEFDMPDMEDDFPDMPQMPQEQAAAPAPAPAPAPNRRNLPSLGPLIGDEPIAMNPISNNDLPPLSGVQGLPAELPSPDSLELPPLPGSSQPAVPAPAPKPVKLEPPEPVSQPVPQPQPEKMAALPPKPAPAPAPSKPSSSGVDETVGFTGDETNISDAAASKLDALAKRILSSGGSVRIEAYADGPPEQASVARRISLSRALSVRAYLIDKGVSDLKINVQARGNKNAGANPNRADIYLN